MTVHPLVFVLAAVLLGLKLFADWNARRSRHIDKRVDARWIDAADLVEYRQNWELLTERETEIAELVGQGKHNSEIAQELSISERTVNAHLRSIYGKLGVRNRVELAHAMREPHK